MASKRHLRHVQERQQRERLIRGCLTKAVYYSQRHAEQVMLKASGRSGEQMHIYRCPDCGHWHMGHPSYRVSKRA